MQIAPDVFPTFGLLALAVLLLWVPAPAVRGNRDWAWAAGLLLACAAGLATRVLDWRGLVVVAVYVALAIGARTSAKAALRIPLLVLTGVCALLLALHKLPGFHNPLIADAVRVSAGALPVTLYANFDKAVAGIVLMGVFCAPLRSAAGWGPMLRRTAPVLLATLVVVLGTGTLLGYVAPDVKWTPLTPWFLAVNLLFTCVAEEAFFRASCWAGSRGRWTAGASARPSPSPCRLCCSVSRTRAAARPSS